MPVDDSVVNELEWVKVTTGPVYVSEQQVEKRTNKFLRNPFIPIGLFGTTAFLFFGLRAMKRGENMNSQRMMRGRVVAQGATIAALVIGFMIEAAADAKLPKGANRNARE